MKNTTEEEPREETLADRAPGQTGVHYKIHQKMLSMGSHYWIENEQGETVYKVDSKLGWRKSFNFEDAQGNKLAKIHKVIISLKETMELEGPDGQKLAVVKKDLITPLKEHFVVELKTGSDLDIRGNLLDHEYTIGRGNQKVAAVSKKLFHLRDSYSVVIEPGQDDVILLAVVVCIDEMTHD